MNEVLDLTELAKRCHSTAREHGFWEHSQLWEGPDYDQPYDNPSIVPEKLMLITTEVGEAMEAFRDGDEDAFGEELADIIIRVLDLARWKGVSIEAAVYQKMQKNNSRPHLHGRLC